MYRDEELFRLWKKWNEKKDRIESYKFENQEMEKKRLRNVERCNKRIAEIEEVMKKK